MAKRTKQAEEASHLREILHQQGLDIPSQQITLANSQQWVIFQVTVQTSKKGVIPVIDRGYRLPA